MGHGGRRVENQSCKSVVSFNGNKKKYELSLILVNMTVLHAQNIKNGEGVVFGQTYAHSHHLHLKVGTSCRHRLPLQENAHLYTKGSGFKF